VEAGAGGEAQVYTNTGGLVARRGEGGQGLVLNGHMRPAGAAHTVFIVDDDPHVANMYRVGLEAFGFSVGSSPDAAGLFAAVDAQAPDVVVVDWQLAGAYGDEVVRQIRMDSRLAGLPVFILSNFPSEADGAIDRVFELGVLGWFEKTKTPPSLLGQKLMEVLAVRSPASR
jgi:CheY-like chemotaxis protein